MAAKYLGPQFDIHGGGIDLIFPHHENEIAQSVGAGQKFARYWMHNAWVTMAGEKMSKSLGNGLLVSEMVQRWRPVELRYYLGAAHYRSTIDFSEAALQEAATAYRRIENFVERSGEAGAAWTDHAPLMPAEFSAAMDDDFGVATALAVVHDTVRQGNAALQAGHDDAAGRARTTVLAMLDVLGLNPLDWADSTSSDLAPVVDGLVALALEQRQQARARKDYAAADAVRDQLGAAGIDIEDTATGPRWTVRTPSLNQSTSTEGEQ